MVCGPKGGACLQRLSLLHLLLMPEFDHLNIRLRRLSCSRKIFTIRNPRRKEKSGWL
nr:MAG TPA: hypothetical protein [Caudoviricetes sp.]DAZ68446.1 MAG TPA: hypothetical protein [Caudoviricetes sp.]